MVKFAERALGLVALIILLLALIYAFAAYPILDDFCFSAKNSSPLEYTRELWFNWSGRWLAMFLYSVTAQADDLRGSMTIIIALLSIATWVAGFYVVAEIARPSERKIRKAAAAVIMFAGYWGFARGIGETVYWTGGYFSYPLPFLLSVIAIHQAERRPALAAVAAVCAAGCNELAGMCLAAWLGVSAVLDRRVRTCAVCVAALVGTLIVALAPGTGVRASMAYAAPNPLKILYNLARPYESTTSVLLTSIVLVFALFSATQPREATTRWWVPLLAGIAAVAGPNLVYVLSVGATPMHRVLDYMLAVALVGAVVTGARVGPTPDVLRPIAALLSVALLFTSPNVARGLHDLPILPTWRAEHQALVIAAEPGTDVVVSDYQNYPSFFLERQIAADPAFSGNVCLAKRWKLNSVHSVGEGKRWQP